VDEDQLLQEHKERFDGNTSRSGNLEHPYLSVLYEREIGMFPRRMPAIRSQREEPTVRNDWPWDPSVPSEERLDVVELLKEPELHRYTITVYDQPDEQRRALRLAKKLKQYLKVMAEFEHDPVTGALSGLGQAWIDPATGLLVEDQENPPQGSILLDAAIDSVGDVANTTTRLNVVLEEYRLALTFEVGVTQVYERRVPTVEHITIRETEPTEDPANVAAIPVTIELVGFPPITEGA